MKTKSILLSLLLTSYLLLSSCVPALQGASTVSSIVSIGNDRRTAGVILDDKTMHLKLLTSEMEDPELSGSHLNYMIYDKSLLITGEVPSKAVQSYVLNKIQIVVPAIKQIYNELTIGPVSGILSRTKDSAITIQVEALFHNQEVFNPTHVRVMTENQNVYLMGSVTDREGSMAAKAAAKAKGVSRVTKMFDYLDSIPEKEVEQQKLKQSGDEEQAELEKLRQQLRDEQLRIQQQIDELSNTN